MLHFLLTILAGGACGYLFYRLKIPGGVLVGSIVGAAILNIGFDVSFVQPKAKVLAQLTAGAFIGSTVSRKGLRRLRHIWRPALLLMSIYLAANFLLGWIIYLISPLDLLTALFCVVPGGISDVPLIAADMGADSSKVAALQFMRMLVCTGTFPSMINWVSRNDPDPPNPEEEAPPQPVEMKAAQTPATEKTRKEKSVNFLLSFATALVCGTMGYLSHIPAGTLVFSMFGVLALNLLTGRVYLPRLAKRIAQIISGTYIGGMMGLSQLMEMRFLLLPMIVQLTGYTAFCFGVSALLRRYFGLSRKESMLTATPSGASDMAFISLDMGVQSADLILLQVIRLVTVMAIFPQIISFVCKLAGF